MKSLSAAVITFNEESKIARALASLVPVADEIVVVDSFSQDRTVEICRGFPTRIIQREWPGYRDQKQFATDQTSHEWVLSLDADEEVSPRLQEEIRRWKKLDAEAAFGYWIPRMTRFMGRWIRRTSWYPDYQLRLFRKDSGRWEGGRVHESFRSNRPTGRMRGHLLHYTYSDLSEYLQQLDRFSELAALDAFEGGRRVGYLKLALHPPLVFFRNYFVRLGFLEGVPGFAVSVMAAVSTLFKQLKLWELQRSAGARGERSAR